MNPALKNNVNPIVQAPDVGSTGIDEPTECSTRFLDQGVESTVRLALEFLFKEPVENRDELHALTCLALARLKLESLGFDFEHSGAMQVISLELIQDLIAGSPMDVEVLGTRVPVSVEIPGLGVRVSTIVDRVDLAEDEDSAALVVYRFEDFEHRGADLMLEPQLLTLIAASDSILGRQGIEVKRYLLRQRSCQTIGFDPLDSECAMGHLAEYVAAVGDDHDRFAESGLVVTPIERAGVTA